MRNVMVAVLTLTAVSGVAGIANLATRAQTTPSSAVVPRSTPLAAPTTKLEDALLEWPLPPGEQAYAGIDGKHLHQ